MSEKKQVLRNLITNIVSLGSRMLVGLWLTPYLVSHLGAAAYGFIPIVLILTGYLGIVTGSLNTSISRFLVISIHQGDWKAANNNFNTAFFSNMAIIGLQVPLFVFVLDKFSLFFIVPASLHTDVSDLIFFSLASFSISVFSTVFSSSMFAYNRVDLMRMIDVIAVIFRLGTIIVLFVVDTPKLYYVGIGELAATLVTISISFIFWKKLTPDLRISLTCFDKARLRKILSMSGWVLVSNVGYLLFFSIDLVVVNRFIGVEEAGQYATVQQWSNVVRTVAGMLAFLVSPLVLASYAKSNFRRLRSIVVTSMKLVGALIATITAILMVQSESLLRLWIGEEIAQIYPLLILFVIHLSANLSAQPLFIVLNAYNKLKVPGIFTVAAGVFNVGLAILLAEYTDLGIYGVALAGLIVLTLKNTVFIPFYVSHIMKVSRVTFLFPILKTVLATCLIFVTSLPVHLFSIDSMGEFFLSSAVVGIISIPITYTIILNKDDKQFVIELLPASVRNKLML